MEERRLVKQRGFLRGRPDIYKASLPVEEITRADKSREKGGGLLLGRSVIISHFLPHFFVRRQSRSLLSQLLE